MTSLAAAPGRPGGRRPLTALLAPRSVAVVGASARPGSFGDTLVAQLLGGGFRGPVHLVNPRYQEVAGLPCLPSLADLPGPVDLAVLAVPNASLERQLRAAAAHGIPAAVIFASCVEVEGGPSEGRQAPPRTPSDHAGRRRPLAERLRGIAAEAGMAVCGGNGMGFFNLEHGVRVCGYPEPADLDAVADAVANLSVLALDLGDRLAALDVNPLVAGPAGCVAVDALVVARAGAAGEPRSATGGRPA